MQVLDLADNHLEGPIPSEWARDPEATPGDVFPHLRAAALLPGMAAACTSSGALRLGAPCQSWTVYVFMPIRPNSCLFAFIARATREHAHGRCLGRAGGSDGIGQGVRRSSIPQLVYGKLRLIAAVFLRAQGTSACAAPSLRASLSSGPAIGPQRMAAHSCRACRHCRCRAACPARPHQRTRCRRTQRPAASQMMSVWPHLGSCCVA